MPPALYRRYRPETFAEVIGQEHVTEPLQQALRRGRTSHAYLFSGPRGCGKTTSARILARCLNCVEGPTPQPCGRCDSCVALARGGPGHIDVIEIDAASHGGVDDARELREKAFFAPAASRYKVYIVDEAHMVSASGFNALLKIVEEPPPHVVFVFATTEPDKVIGTIRSRTHHYPFRLVPPRRLLDHLADVAGREGVAVEKGVLPLVVRAGAGSVRDAMSVLDQLVAGAGDDGVSYRLAVGLLGYTDGALLDDAVEALAAGDGSTAFRVVDRVVEAGHDPRRFAEDLLERVRDLIVLQAAPDAAAEILDDVPEDQLERLRGQASRLGAAELSRAGDLVATALTEMRGATTPRLHLELLVARILLPGAEDDARSLAARLDRVERRLAVAGAPSAGPAAGVRPVLRPAAPAPAGEVDGHAAPASAPARPGPAEQGGGDGAGRGPAGARPGSSPAAAAAAEPAAEGARPAAEPAAEPAAGPGVEAWPEVALPPAGAPGAFGEDPARGGSAAVAPPEHPPTGPVAAPAPPGAPPPAPHAPPHDPPTVDGRPADAPHAPPVPVDPAAAGAMDLAAVRGLWTEVLDRLRRKRVTWSLVAHNASVVDLSEGRLVLGFPHAALRDRFGSGAHGDWVRQALIDAIGLDVRVEAILDPSAGGSPAPPRGGARAPEPDPGPPADLPAWSPPGQGAPGQGAAGQGAAGRGGPDDGAGAERGPARAPAGRPAGAAPVAPAPPAPAGPGAAAAARAAMAAGAPPAAAAAGRERPRPPEDGGASADDPDVDDTGLSGRDLLVRELGATVIGEYDE
ncbi:DNA polymerase III subunit gamma and tau [Vallicoccus soli]|uniref:DNA polymerase III subunit gamma/tau n=1 Tax=Vallicoccus soli TaxID=2339232 RepID=A0A3A3ZM32_9ACTN|nr:DNA polymerase III subunit gamma and tau [Vallicoccus soli]RJK97645.1 DNA polymerase III subunit gamma and tau [Vallicoccus soli]